MTGLARATVALAVAGVLLAGCSSSSDFSMSDGAGSTVRADVLALTTAIAHHQWSTADTALAQLRSDVAAALAAGQMSELQARVVRADAAMIAADLAAHRASTTPLPPLTSSTAKQQPKPGPGPKPAPKPKPEPKPKHDGHGHGHGGHGEHGGD